MFTRTVKKLIKPFIFTGISSFASYQTYSYFTSEKGLIYKSIASGLPLSEETLKKLQELEKEEKVTFLKYTPLEAALRLNNKEAMKQLLKQSKITQLTRELAILKMNTEILEEMLKYDTDITSWKFGEIPILKYFHDKNPALEKWLQEKIQK